ncbi:MAG: CehA/McbA family metallohydrolase [Chloroflexota bacterium]
MRVEGHLGPSQARSILTYPLDVAPGTCSITLRLRYWPDQVARIRNLVTLSLYDAQGFRGAGHRHAPTQTVAVGRREATPGFIPGPINPGRWTVALDLHAVLPSLRGGVDFVLEVESSLASAQEAAMDEESPEEEPIEKGAPNEPELVAGAHAGAAPSGWLKGDLHVHSNHSDGRWSIDDLVQHVRLHRLDFLALTDHNTISGRTALRRALADAALSPLLIDGMELTTFWGHANALGVSEWIDWRVRGPAGQGGDGMTTVQSAAGQVHGLGGLFVVNHPRSAGYPWCTGCRWEYGDETLEYADAIEVLNGAWPRKQNKDALALWDRWLNEGYRIPATAGTDSHGFAKQPDLLGFTYVRSGRSAGSILDAVKRGNGYLSRGPSIEWLPDRPDGEAAVRIGGVNAQLDVVLVADGKVVSRTRANEDGDVRFAHAGAYRWLRAELYTGATKGPLALTNPCFSGPT